MEKVIQLGLVVIITIILTNFAFASQLEPTCSCTKYRRLSLKSPLMTGEDIWELQRELKLLGFYKQKLNSTYDGNTYLAVKEFQAANGLSTTGIVTGEVWQKLGQIIHGQNSITSTKTKDPRGRISILINTYQKKLVVYSDGQKHVEFPIAIGKYSTKSPVGEFKIIEKVDMWDESAFGDKWMRLNVPWGNYGIHGTNKPGSIGYATSNGCIRMFKKDVNLLYSWVEIGTRVKIIGRRDQIRITHRLRPNHKGEDILLLQEKLREHGFNPGYTNGRFDNDTEDAIKELKYIYGLQDDLVADKNTFYILNLNSKTEIP